MSTIVQSRKAAVKKRPWWVHLLIFLGAVAIVACGDTIVLLHAWPTITYSTFHREIASGFGSGKSVPDNTLYIIPSIASPDLPGANSLVKSGNQDGLYTLSWLDLSKGPQAISIPKHDGRYLNISLIDPATGVVIGNLKAAGITTICGAGTPCSAAHAIQAPGTQVLMIGRTFVANQSDLSAALAIARQISLAAKG